MNYKVELKDNSHKVIGLEDGDYYEGNIPDPDTMLIYHYPEGDIDTRMKDSKMMHAALYDLFQTHEDLKEGDRFETEFGTFECRGVHVVKVS